MTKCADIRREIARCAKCGKCQSVCPVYIETGDESAVARGRITLAEAVMDGRLKLSWKVKAYLWTCLKCLRCSSVCPSGVAYEMILQKMRDEIARKRGVPWIARAIFRFVLPRRRLFDRLVRVAERLQRVLPIKREGMVRHLPLMLLGRQSVPSLADQSALDALTDHQPKGGRPCVGLFLGCLTNYAYPQIAAALIEVFDRAGYDVVIPDEQVCCGTPVVCFGDTPAARRLAQINVDAFRDCDAVVTACASCGRTLKSDYEELMGEEGQALSDRTFMATELLAKEGLVERLGRDGAEKVTYHDPCHMNWGQGITQPPRDTIAAVAQLVEMSEPDRCCGAAGSFSLFHYDIACKIAAHKVESIRASGADVVATSCPGCMLHIADRLDAAGVSVDVKHTLEVAAGESKE